MSLPQVMNQKNLEFSDEKIGIVSPIYGHEMPDMVKEFIQKARFHTNYFYLILTYGNRHGGAAELAQSFCLQQGIKVQYANVIQMVDNWLPAFDMNEQMKIDKHVDEKIDEMRKDIEEKRKFISEVCDEDRKAHQQFLERTSQMPADAWQHLIRITDKCVGCEICEKVCLTESICVENGKVFFHSGKCQTYFACVHACPQKAIGLTIPEKNADARYRNENIALQELIKANCQKEN